MATPQRRWPFFFCSLLLHISTVAFLVWVDAAVTPASLPRYEVLPLPDPAHHDDKVVWYDFRKSVPEIAPDRPFGPAKTPRGERSPTQTLITIAPDAPSTRQLIRQPDHPEPLPADVPAPNLVAVAAKPSKVFVAPPAATRSQPAAAAVVEAPPAPAPPNLQTGNALSAIVPFQKPPPKPFVAPPARASGGRVARPVEIPTPPPTDVRANDARSGQIPGLQAVIVGLNPVPALPPPGSRSAQIAKAPDAGQPSSGTHLQPDAAVVPGVLSHAKAGDAPTLAALVPSVPARREIREIVLPGVNRTMSAPLRPSSRMIPAAVEAQFAHRNVYTLVIPAPALPGYGGDWVMWFAERDPPDNDSRPNISAPIPARKYPAVTNGDDPWGEIEKLLPFSSTFQFAAVVDKTGHVGSASVLRGAADPALRRRVLDELASWEFKPALRNGEAMSSDVVVEIPFRFQPAAEVRR